MGRVDAARELGALLSAPELPYRARWIPHGRAPRRGHTLNRAAVGRVVAAYLVNAHLLDEVLEPEWPRTHKDWLQRCLGTARPEAEHPLDWESLSLFCDAFDLAPRHRAHLTAMWEAPPGGLVLTRPAALLDAPEDADPPTWPAPSGYHSIGVLEEHVLGADRRPRLHRTTMRLVADVEGLSFVTYMFDADSVVVELQQGGSALGPIYQAGDGLWAQDVFFDRPMAVGEERQVVYTCHYRYLDDPRPEYRRTGSSHPDTPIRIRLSFDPSCPPASVRRCLWATRHSPPIAETLTELDDSHSVGVNVTLVRSGALVGFRWTWPD